MGVEKPPLRQIRQEEGLLMPDYPKMLMLTPGGKAISVSVITQKHPVRGIVRNSLVPLLDESGVNFLAECIKERIAHKRDCPVLVTGDRGIGKSTVKIKTARKIDPKFDIDKIAFHLEEFERIFANNPYGDADKNEFPQVDMDEAGHALYGPDWLQKEQRIIAKQLIISRIKHQIIWMAVPKRMQFNNQLRNMAAIWVHVSEPQEFVQGYALVRMAPAHLQSEWHSDRYWEPKFAFVFTAETGELWERYETKKIAFVNEVTADTANGRTKRRDDFEAEVVKRLIDKKMSQSEIAVVIGRDQSTVSRILSTTKPN